MEQYKEEDGFAHLVRETKEIDAGGGALLTFENVADSLLGTRRGTSTSKP
jgi:hypothetical protein